MAPQSDRAILQPDTIAATLRPQVSVPQNAALSWALGWGVQQTAAGTAIWQWGNNPGFRNVVIADPQQQSGIVVLTNGDNGLKVCEQILTETVGGEYPFFSVIHRPMLGLEHQPGSGEDPP